MYREFTPSSDKFPINWSEFTGSDGKLPISRYRTKPISAGRATDRRLKLGACLAGQR
jgi:hypothetical protein